MFLLNKMSFIIKSIPKKIFSFFSKSKSFSIKFKKFEFFNEKSKKFMFNVSFINFKFIKLKFGLISNCFILIIFKG